MMESKPGEAATMDPAKTILGVSDPAVCCYLMNVAETIRHVLMPQLDAKGQARARECLETLTRIATHMQPSNNALQELTEGGEYPALEAIEAEARSLYDSIANADAPAGRDFDAVRLETYLQNHVMGGPDLRLTGATQLQGGRSKQTILVTQQGARDLPEELVVRQDWVSSVTETSVYSEFEVLKRVADAQLKVPRPLFLETGSEALGTPFIVLTRCTGKAEGDPFTPPQSERAVLQLAEQAGRLHALPSEDFDGLPGIEEKSYTSEQLREDLATYRGLIDQFSVASDTVTSALAWVDSRIYQVSGGPRSLVHGDLGFHNFLCTDGELTAILDWETAHVGSPARDLGYLRSTVTQVVSWPHFLEVYHAAGGPEIDPITVDFYTLFSSLWLYSIVLKAREGLISGQIHDMEITHVCAHFAPALLVRLARQLDLVQS